MHRKRKSDHITINLAEDVECEEISTGFERYRFVHCALPDVNLADINTATSLLGKQMRLPLLISSMTGGVPEAKIINTRLAEAAQQMGIAMGVGSQRAALENGSLADTYQVRAIAPDILLMANLGAVQLNYGYGVDDCRRAVAMIEADALILHLNPLQEAVQPEGNTQFAGLLPKIEAVCKSLDVPVVVKEVGWGISESVSRQLATAGVAAIDAAGAGGTSWSNVELHRTSSDHGRAVAEVIAPWGIPTAESLLMCRRGAPNLPILASGGIRNGLHIAKAIALGAAACGIAQPFLRVANISTDAVVQYIRVLEEQFRLVMFGAGAADIAALQQTPLQIIDAASP